MKIKNKGKVYPSPSSSSSASLPSPPKPDAQAVLKLLPATILALASLLSLQDREVLAYMVTRSIKTNPFDSSSSSVEDRNKKKHIKVHKSPLFDCGCFDCYTSYWFRWDSSPNRELIHQAIEAFEEHLTNGENSTRTARAKKKERTARRVTEKPAALAEPVEQYATSTTEADASGSFSPEKYTGETGDNEDEVEAGPMAVVRRSTEASNHKGLARKVLPDVLGLLNSRLWSLWSPTA